VGFLGTLLRVCTRKTPENSNDADRSAEGSETLNQQQKNSGLLSQMLIFAGAMADNITTERIKLLTLRDVITRFVDLKPDAGNLRGALLVQPHREGSMVYWIFLDSANNLQSGDDGLPLGAKAICTNLDEELATMLGGRDVLIVE
jgi:hypothetical protein